MRRIQPPSSLVLCACTRREHSEVALEVPCEASWWWLYGGAWGHDDEVWWL